MPQTLRPPYRLGPVLETHSEDGCGIFQRIWSALLRKHVAQHPHEMLSTLVCLTIGLSLISTFEPDDRLLLVSCVLITECRKLKFMYNIVMTSNGKAFVPNLWVCEEGDTPATFNLMPLNYMTKNSDH
jgi:hypothetical protein